MDQPFEKQNNDLTGPLTTTARGMKYNFATTDHLTHMLILEAIPHNEKATIAQVFVDEIYCKYGVPRTIISDNGGKFVNDLSETIEELLHIKHIRTAPHHPESNGRIE